MKTAAETVAIFFSSSDNTRDVFERVFPVFRKHWPDCPYSVYAGFNHPVGSSLEFTPVYAPVAGWGTELRAQIEQVPADRILLFLDDFVLLQRVDTEWMQDLLITAVARDLPYLGFRQLRRPALSRLARGILRRGAKFEAMPHRHPYYSSLQVALWEKKHLISCLERETNIWNFERIRPEGAVHYAICGAGPLRYRHIVEKGRWLPVARKTLTKNGVSGDLGRRAAWANRYQVRHVLGLVRFEIIGYWGMRVRRVLTDRRRRP